MRIVRLTRILRVFLRHRLDRLVPRKESPLWLRVLLSPLALLPTPKTPVYVSLREALEELGPIFVKFGQILSTRKDLFAPDYSQELEKLQDRVPPFDSDVAVALIEAHLEGSVHEVFKSFDATPLASASVAQVHTAELHTGEEVVVKVIRPGIEKTIRQDLTLMYTLASMIERFWSEGRRLHPVDVVRDYEHTIINELNLSLEASNTARLREHWQHTGKLYVPRIYWDYCGQDVMVMERIYGVMANDIEALKANKVNLKKLAHLGVEIFFTQVFDHNFFHADMHPGNVFIDITDPENPTYIALDCAIIGSLTESDKTYLAKNLLAFFHEDYREVARLHVDSGWVPAHTNVDDFEAVIRSVCEPVFHKPIKDISFGKVLVSLFNTARQFEMEIQPQLVLLQKTLLNIEGMGRQIYDDLDLWETAAPYMERWMDNRIGVRGILGAFAKQAPALLERLPELPTLAITALEDLSQMNALQREQAAALTGLRLELAEQRKRSSRQRVGGLLILGGFLTALVPLYAGATSGELIIGSGIAAGLGIYWTFIHA